MLAEKVREEELRGLGGYNGRRKAPLAYAAGIEDNIMMHPREVILPLLTAGQAVGDVVGHGEPKEVQALVSDPMLVTIKVRVKASLIVRKWDVCISTTGKVRALRPTDAHFPTILVSQCMSLREKVKESVRDRILLVLPLPLGGMGETPREDVTPLEAVRRVAEAVEGDQLTFQNTRLSLAINPPEGPVPSGIGVPSSMMIDKQEGRSR